MALVYRRKSSQRHRALRRIVEQTTRRLSALSHDLDSFAFVSIHVPTDLSLHDMKELDYSFS